MKKNRPKAELKNRPLTLSNPKIRINIGPIELLLKLPITAYWTLPKNVQ